MDLNEPLDAKEGEAALQRLRDADPALYLSPSADLAAAPARAASKHLHSSLALFSPAQPPPLLDLLAGPAFDAEQIWSQIELLSRPILPHLRRQLRRLEHQRSSQPPPPPPSKLVDAEKELSDDEEDEEGDELEELKEEKLEDIDDELELADEEEEEAEESEGRAGNGVEDKFLKIKELEEFLEKGEEEEYGGGAMRGGEKKATKNWMEEESDEEDGDEDEEVKTKTMNTWISKILRMIYDDEEDAGKTGGGVMYKEFFEK